MQFDNNSLKKITNMNDKDLREIIASAAREKGLSLPNISDSDLRRIRFALSGMTAADLERLTSAFGEKGGRR